VASGFIRIRKARRADCAELTRIAHAAKRFWGYPEKLIRLWERELTITPDFVVQHAVYCAVRRSSVIGFYAFTGKRASRDLEHMWVDPERIGHGVGRSLFAHLLRRLRRSGVARLTIEADPNAEGFYRKLGARRVGRIPSKPAGRYLPLLVVHVRPDRRSIDRSGPSRGKTSQRGRTTRPSGRPSAKR
jgi:GNAT superfamily N-acetyltransferase